MENKKLPVLLFVSKSGFRAQEMGLLCKLELCKAMLSAELKTHLEGFN